MLAKTLLRSAAALKHLNAATWHVCKLAGPVAISVLHSLPAFNQRRQPAPVALSVAAVVADAVAASVVDVMQCGEVAGQLQQPLT